MSAVLVSGSLEEYSEFPVSAVERDCAWANI